MRASQQDGLYPRPQLLRTEWANLDGIWDFAYDDEDAGLADRWYLHKDWTQSIRVPFAPESQASGIGDHGIHPILWYRRNIRLDALPERRHLLHFGAVDHEADVWVDGQHVGHHSGGQAAFSFDITDSLAPGATHDVVVRAFDDPQGFELPRGKQDWRPEPHFIWYRRTSGIWKTVWLETVPRCHVVELDWRPELDSTSVRVDVRLSSAPLAPSWIEVELWNGQSLLGHVMALMDDQARLALTVDVPAWRNGQERERFLWSPETPVLIDAVLRVRSQDTVTDEVWSYFGLRTVGAGRGRFLLNDRPYQLCAVLEQGYWEGSQLTPPSPEALRHEVEVIKQLGFNAVRIHQKVEDPRFLYWADQLGLLVWGETAAAYEYSPRAAAALVGEWIEIIRQQKNHPSIATWVPLNESWGVQDVSKRPDQQAFVHGMTELTRALDPTRPVVSNDGWEHIDSDLLTIHDYSSEPATIHDRYKSRESVKEWIDGMGPQGRRPVIDDHLRAGIDELPIVLSEFGGIAYSQDDTWGYSLVTTDTEFKERLAALFDAVGGCAALAGFCYTQLTDTLQESNGLLTAARVPKLPLDELRAIITGTAATPAEVDQILISDSYRPATD